MVQLADTETGNYYVTVADGGRVSPIVGPFKDNHQAALDLVDQARQVAQEVDPRAAFYAFGTARYPAEYDIPGMLNGKLGVQ